MGSGPQWLLLLALYYKMEIPYTFAGLFPPPPEKTRVAVLPVAYDGTTSFQPGTRFGPQEIIMASRFLELYDEALGLEPTEVGITTLPELWPAISSPESALSEVEKEVSKILKKGLFPAILGGEHTLTYGAVRAMRRYFPDLSVLILDAHADLRDSYQGTKFNHACVSRRIIEEGLPVTIMGVRSLPSENLPFLRTLLSTKEKGAKVIWAERLKEERDWYSLVSNNLTKNVYLSIDLDFYDPSEVPAVGTPEPGGFGWRETDRFLRTFSQNHKIVAFDIVELNGMAHHLPSAYLASRLALRLIGMALHSV